MRQQRIDQVKISHSQMVSQDLQMQQKVNLSTWTLGCILCTNMLQQLKEESWKDAELPALKEVIIEGWPTKQKELRAPLNVYW